jgi:hypothetical protein
VASRKRKIEDVQLPDALGVSISGSDEQIVKLEMTNNEHLDALQAMIDRARALNTERDGGGPVAINYVIAVTALLLSATNQDVIDMFAELYVELEERGVPLASVMPEPEPVQEELTEDNLTSLACFWSAFLDTRRGWDEEKCHNIQADEVVDLLSFVDVAIAQGKRPAW